MVVNPEKGYFFFIFGSLELFSQLRGDSDENATMFPTWVAVLLVVVPFSLLDALAWWHGRQLPKGAPGLRPQELQLCAEDLGFRSMPPVLRELAVLPLLTLIPIIMAQDGLPHPANRILQIVTLVLLGASSMTTVLAGGLPFATVLVVCWAGWAWIALHGDSTWPTVGLLAVTMMVGVLYFSRVMKATTAREGQGLVTEGDLR